MIAREEWDRVWSAALKISDNNPGLVFIGGVAVYLHVVNSDPHSLSSGLDMVEFSHDADAYVSLAEFADIRDFYVVTPNRLLNKHQAIVDGEVIDLYVERNNDLAVPYDDLVAYAIQYGEVKAACLEHLLVLKLDAALDRKGTPKGDKDERDIIKIVCLMKDNLRAELVGPYLSDRRLEMLERVERSSGFIKIAQGKAFEAKKLRQSYLAVLMEIKAQPARWAPREG